MEAAHAKQIAALRTELDELKAKLARRSRNSSRPPSSDPPWEKRPPRKKPSGRKPGGQPGHKGKTRPLIPTEDVDEIVTHRVEQCPDCGGTDLEQTNLFRHQVTEIPPTRPHVTEHQVLSVRCRGCGACAAGELPVDVARSQFGPRVHALAAHMTGGFRLTHREAALVFEEVFGLKIGVGSMTALQGRVRDALEAPFREAQRVIREGFAAFIDETSWRLRRRKAYLWAAHHGELVIYHVDRRRNRAAFRRLMAGKYHGVRVVDRYAVHDDVPDERRQWCLGHLLRDFEGYAGGPAGRRMFGRRGKAILKRVFRMWWRLQDGLIDRARLQLECGRFEKQMKALLEEGMAHSHAKVRGFARKVRANVACLFTFAKVEGIEPTSNPAERVLRPAVLWRKGSFGSHSEQGARFASRILTATRSLRLQGRNVLDFLVEALDCHVHVRDSPSLLPAVVTAAA